MNAVSPVAPRPAVAVSPLRRAAIALAVGLAALAYLLPFRAYGLNVEDEGTLLYQILRVTRGELPYVDFSTGYTPGFFAIGALLWQRAGDLVTFRVELAFVHAATVGGLAALIAGVARPALALSLPFLYLAFIPVYPGEFCAFNVAYPAWFATAAWLATAGAVLAFAQRHRRPWLVVAGLAAAAALAVKPNAGVFAFGAAAASVLAIERRGAFAGLVSALCWALAFVGVLLGVWVVFGVRPRPLDVAVYLVPLLAAMAVFVTRSQVRRPGVIADLLALGLPFAAVSAPWLIYFWRRLGTDGFLREVLLIGSGAADLYYIPFPAFERWGLLLATLAVGFATAGMLAQRWLVPRLAVATLITAGIAGMAAVMRRGLMPEGVLWSIIWQLESAAFALTLCAQLAGIAWLWRRRRAARRESTAPVVDPASATLTILVLFAVFMHFQLYPRADFMHLLIAAPLSLVLAALLLERVLVVWEGALHAQATAGTFRAIEIGTVAVVTIAIGVGLAPGVQALTAGPRFLLPFTVAPVGVETGRADDLRGLAAAGKRLARTVSPKTASLGFPGIGVLLFLTDARNPTPHDYFYPGRPDHREEAEILDAVAATSPLALAALNRRFTFFDAAQTYYFLLRRFVRARYGLVERAGRFDVLERGAPAAAAPVKTPPAMPLEQAIAAVRRAADLARRLETTAALAAYPADETAAVLLELATADEAALRHAALQALLAAIERSPERGLEHYVRANGVDRRDQILLLRSVRDMRDGRAASYLFAVVGGGDLRLAIDALGAMQVTRAALIARRHLWAGAETPVAWPGREALLAQLRATLAADVAPTNAIAFAADLAGALGDTGAIPLLRRHWQDGLPRADASALLTNAAITASAADALATLAPDGLACELTRVLARGDAAIQELIPTRLLDLAEGREPIRSEARRCIAEAIAAGPARAPVVWVAAALGDAVFTPVVRDALGAPSPDDRRAAAWALGELPADEPSAAALADRAVSDPDEIVRRLAAGAAAKQRGAHARSLHDAPDSGFSRPAATGYKTPT